MNTTVQEKIHISLQDENPRLTLPSFGITSFPPLIGELKHIEELDLSNNLMRELPSLIGNLVNLCILDLRLNNLSSLPSEIKNLEKLSKLFLQSNKFRLFPKQLCHIPNLEVLDFSHNSLTALPEKLNNFKKIKKLDLSFNNLKNIPLGIFNLESLEYLDLSGNCLQSLPAGFSNLSKLSFLNISKNNLTCLSTDFKYLKNLTSLNIEKNDLEKFPPEIMDLKNIQTLILRNNKINSIPSSIIELSRIKDLYLGNNNLVVLPKEICSLDNLSTLDLSSNKIEKINTEIGNLPKLERINLTNNPIKHLPNEIIFNSNVVLPFLRYISKHGVTTIKIPEKLKTAFKQYLIFFSDYVKKVKGKSLELEVISTPGGVTLEILEANIDLEIASKYLSEYLSFVKKSVDDIPIIFEREVSEDRKDIIILELKTQIQHLQHCVEILKLEKKYLERMVCLEENHFQLISSSSLSIHNYNVSKNQANSISSSIVDFKLGEKIVNLQDGFDEIKPLLLGLLPNKEKEIEHTQEELDQILVSSDKNVLQKSGVGPKIKRLIENSIKKLGKIEKSATTIEKSFKHLKKLGNAYNKIAEWVGWPQVPRVLLESEKK